MARLCNASEITRDEAVNQRQNENLTSGTSAASSAGLTTRLRYQGSAAQARRIEKRRLVLGWLQRFGSTDQSVIMRLLGVSRSGSYQTLRQLEAAKLIQRVPVDGCVAAIYILTASGRAESEIDNGPHLVDSGMGWCELWARAPVHPSKLPISHIQHDHLVQHVTLDLVGHRQVLADAAREAGFIVDTYGLGIDDAGFDYVPSRTVRKATLKDVGVNTKVPDLVLGLGLQGGLPGAIIAVEVQQTYQSGEEAEADLSRYCQEMSQSGTRLFKVIYASSRPAVLDYYRQRMTPSLGFWVPKTEKSGYTKVTGRPSPATPEIVERFEFRDISRLHRAYYSGP